MPPQPALTPDPDHLLIAYAASRAPGAPEALQGLRLPNLEKLLARLQPGALVAVDAESPDMPHERALAAALGLRTAPGHAPWAALQMRAGGGEPGNQAWAWITPCHWQIGMDHVLLQDPASLHLTGEEDQALRQAMAPFFLEDGLDLLPDQPGRWLACGEVFRDLETASIDRVSGRHIGPWLPPSDAARPLRRLQSEMQMLLYQHPVNDERSARGVAPVNSFWISGAGALNDAGSPRNGAGALPPPTVELGLRDAALSGDWAQWRTDWQVVDARACAALLARHAAGVPVHLTLCGDENYRCWQGTPQGLLQRFTSLFGTLPASNGLLLL